ncbi:glucose-6-phosphatase 3 isoform X2 [Ostrinia furnacalis]|uniref:glucose-6-phosphatase 3 isoform X1 n=1 Tax=Ostrinia furnacalis TaxID=93504 RepID=UPI00103AF25F|nr:glucose-6-phosphatase 3 isoform X1 [Ostrinia furnacalis]XP_028174062.1 glucose-6-phosphatase 3 isoform X2 [Ostrinia furnacalis]
MDRLYALGVSCIEFLQDWFADSENYFEWVNDLSNPHYVMEYLFPFVSTLDSVFAAQLLLCMSFGGWLNSVMKWWLLEDRPYWWVRETSFYEGARRPQLRQFRQTCETGPGSPSGHSTTVAMLLLLAIMWISHIMNDRKCYIWWWKYIVYPVFACALGSVMLARMFVATHFPHQTLMGALVGSLLAPALCIYVCDPYVWGFGPHGRSDTRRAVAWHVFSALVTVAISVVTYFSLTLCGWDPHWTVKLAFRWCENPEDIHVSTTPMYALVQATASMLGWALAVTPAVAQFRHYTKNRSLILSGLAMYLLYCGTRHLQENIDKNSTLWFYSMQFLLAAVRPFLYLRVVPTISMLPYPSVGTGKHKRE